MMKNTSVERVETELFVQIVFIVICVVASMKK